MALLDPGPVQKWLDEQHGGDELVAFTRVMTPTNHEIADVGPGGGSAGGGSVGSTEATRQSLGLDPQNKSWLLHGRAGLLVVTATHFYLLRLGGLKEKIKETLFDTPRTQIRVTALDHTIDRIDWRHWLIEGLPDGAYLLEPQVLGKGGKPSKIAPGSNAFLAQLGDQAQP
ncbi:MAG: hypothetical protein RIB98_04630 [Acidimicrobiales bacterium]